MKIESGIKLSAEQLVDLQVLLDNHRATKVYQEALYRLHNAGIKLCTRCNSVNPATLEYFSKSSSTKAGLQSNCKSCCSEQVNKCIREAQEENPGYRAEYDRKYREENRDRIREAKRKYNEEHKEQRAEANRQWNQENQEVRRAMNSMRRAAEMRAIPLWAFKGDTESDRVATQQVLYARLDADSKASADLLTDEYRDHMDQLEYDKYAIQDMTGVEMHLDHMISLSTGGKHCPTNLMPMPGWLNVRKHAKSLGIDWELPSNVYENSTGDEDV